MFGKDYSNEISELKEVISDIQRQQGTVLDVIKSVQKQSRIDMKSLIQIATVQATHKESITFLLNHCTVDANAQEDFFKMLKKISEVNKIVEKT